MMISQNYDTLLPFDLIEVDETTPGKVDLMRSLNTYILHAI